MYCKHLKGPECKQLKSPKCKQLKNPECKQLKSPECKQLKSRKMKSSNYNVAKIDLCSTVMYTVQYHINLIKQSMS